MLKLILGTDWTANRRAILSGIASDVRLGKSNRILMVPELISHDTERRLCAAAGPHTSRYAEVLSFSRLARRVADAAGHGALPCLDEGGRVVAMAAAIQQVYSRLKTFASVMTKPEFIAGLIEVVDECKRCCVDASALMRASRESTGVLAQKLEELALILETYDGICNRGKKDPRDLMSWLLEELECSDYAQEHVFYIDGFPDFTAQHMQILAHLISTSPEVTICLTCDKVSSGLLAYERAGNTAAELVRIAQRADVEYEISFVPSENKDTEAVARRLFQGDLNCDYSRVLTVSEYVSVHQECEAVAEEILETVRKGDRFRDISVVCADMPAYRNTLSMVFKQCGIPVYISGTESVLEKPVIVTVLAAVDAVIGGFAQRDVLRYLKTALSPISLEECDLLENYVIMWSVSGSKFTSAWKKHPFGLGEPWTEAAYARLEELNQIRNRAIEPLRRLKDAFVNATDAAKQVVALYDFLVEIDLAQRLENLAQELEASDNRQEAQVLSQLWEILITALEQMHDVLANSTWDADVFSRLLRLLLGRYDAGTIPTVLDSVTAGPINAMRCQEVKHLYLLGALEGAFPGYGGSPGILTDQDRGELRRLGVPLNAGAAESLQTEFAEIYGVFCGAEKTIHISCPAGQPSYIYMRLKGLSPAESPNREVLGAAISNKAQAAAYLLRRDARNLASALDLLPEYQSIAHKRDHLHGHVAPERVRALYGNQLKLSASQIDKYANCAMSYFLKYGLRAKERKPAQVDPAEFGTFIHYVLEKTARKIVSLGGFKAVSQEETQKIAAEYAQSYAQTRFADLDSERIVYLFNRNGRELELIVEELWRELRESDFDPVMFELSFGGEDASYPAIDISGQQMEAKVRGFVDRVDTWQSEYGNYFRVIDYKTGAKHLDYCDIINGIGLQMLLYLFALTKVRSAALGQNPKPAGVQYFPARAPLVTVESVADEDAAIKEREKHWRRSGLLLRDDTVLSAMEPGDQPSRMPYKRKKDGSLSGDLADERQFSMLRSFIYQFLRNMVDDIASGNVTANPYTRDAQKSACRYCPYSAICHKSDVAGRRVYQAINAERFWEDIEKAVSKRG